MTKQCPSCGGDCGHTKAKGCQYNAPKPAGAKDMAIYRKCASLDSKNVVPGNFKKSALTTLQKTIKREVLEYAGRISLAEAIGVLEVVKHDLIEEHRE